MINFIVCDDNDITKKNIEKTINKVMMQNDYHYKIYLYNDYDDNFIKNVENNLSNKIYILDLQTPSCMCIQIAKKIRQKDHHSIIIFLSSNYGLEMSLLEDELMFLTCISKFNQEEKLISAIKTSLDIIGSRRTIKIEDGGCFYTIPVNDILYITRDSINRKCIIKTDDNEFKVNKTLSEICEIYKNDFTRTHRSCLVNKNRVRIIDKKHHLITFDNNNTIDLLSDKYKKSIC